MRYWFKPRRYGYGATPVTSEGWILTVASAAIVAASIIAMNLFVDRTNIGAWLIWAAIVVGITFWFVCVSRRRTDGEWRWRWGQRSGGLSDSSS
jgi:hypothetical protein